MNDVVEFEKYVIREICQSVLPSELIESLLESGASSYEYTGCGYFLRFSHSDLPQERSVHSEPTLNGSWNGIESGFVVFIEKGKLTLECHDWGLTPIPSHYREQLVNVTRIET